MTEEPACPVLLAEGQSGGGGGQRLMSREAAGQTVSRRSIFQPVKRKERDRRWIWFDVFPPRRLVSALTLLSKKLNCYKTTLECSDKNVAFYQKFGYNPSNETYMQCRFFDWGRRRPLMSPFQRAMMDHRTPSQPRLVLNWHDASKVLWGVSWIAPIKEMFELSVQPSIIICPVQNKGPMFKIERHLKVKNRIPNINSFLVAVIGAKHWAAPTYNWKYLCVFERFHRFDFFFLNWKTQVTFLLRLQQPKNMRTNLVYSIPCIHG